MNNATNFSFAEFYYCEEHVHFKIEPELRDSVPYFVAVVLIFTSGFIGNIATVLIISFWRKLHTPTFTMIACLAASDAYSLLSFTLTTYTNLESFITCKLRIFAHAVAFSYCFLILFFLGRFNAGMQLCLLSSLRFTAIVHPLKFKTYCTCKAVIVMSFVGSVVSLIPVAVTVLTMAFIAYEEYYVVNTVIFAVNFIVPSSLFTVLHCLKLRALRRSPTLNSNSSLKMNVVVSIVLSIYVISSVSMMMTSILVWQYEAGLLSFDFVSSLSFLINCAINPFIYFFSSPPIVQIFRNIWHSLCKKCQVANNGNTQEIEMHNVSST